MSVDDPRETATIQIRFLRHVLDRLDALAEQASPWDGIRRLHAVIAQRLTVITDTEPTEADTDTDATVGGHGRLALLAVELHRLRRTRTPATLTTGGGHRLRVQVRAVGRRHILVHTDGGHKLAALLVPLRFIESVNPLLEPAARH